MLGTVQYLRTSFIIILAASCGNDVWNVGAPLSDLRIACETNVSPNCNTFSGPPLLAISKAFAPMAGPPVQSPHSTTQGH
eukprot:3863852-Amphidinium_carterae.1